MALERFFVRPAPAISALRVLAGSTLGVAGTIAGSVVLLVIGATLLAWAALAITSTRPPACRLQPPHATGAHR